jgi:hypothetical protein
MPPRRRKQRIDRNDRISVTENPILSITTTYNDGLLEFADEFVEIGRRSYKEVAIHEEL